MGEKELVEEFKRLKELKTELKKRTTSVESKLNQIMTELIDLLTDEGKTATAKYENIGSITLLSPILRASVNKAYEDDLFEWVKKMDRAMIIKESIHHGTLSSFIEEMQSKNVELPVYVKIHYQNQVRLNQS